MQFFKFFFIMFALVTSSMAAATCQIHFDGFDGPTFWGPASPIRGRLLRNGQEICWVPAGKNSDDLNGFRTMRLPLDCISNRYSAHIYYNVAEQRWTEWDLLFRDSFDPKRPADLKFVLRLAPEGPVGNGGGFRVSGSAACPR